MFREQMLFYLVFLGQILLVSGYFPSRLATTAGEILERYPPSSHPRLYTASVESMEQTLRTYRWLNRAALLLGFGVIALDVSLGGELVSWNSGTIVAAYMLIQYLPLIACVSRPSFPYFSSERQPPFTRTAELRPRRLRDVVSPGLALVAAVLFLLIVVLVVVVNGFDYPWFGGYANLVGLTAIYLVFAASAWMAIRNRKGDPWSSSDERRRGITRTVNMAVVLCIVWTSFVGLAILLRTLDLPELLPATLSLVVILATFAQFRTLRVEDQDFDVYREEATAA